MTIQTLAGNKNIHFLIELNSSQTIYDRQATFGFLSCGEGKIVINGNITNTPLNRTDLANKIIMLQAVQNNKLIYEE